MNVIHVDHLQKKHVVEYKDFEEKKKLDLKEQKDRCQLTMEDTWARVKV